MNTHILTPEFLEIVFWPCHAKVRVWSVNYEANTTIQNQLIFKWSANFTYILHVTSCYQGFGITLLNVKKMLCGVGCDCRILLCISTISDWIWASTTISNQNMSEHKSSIEQWGSRALQVQVLWFFMPLINKYYMNSLTHDDSLNLVSTQRYKNMILEVGGLLEINCIN